MGNRPSVEEPTQEEGAASEHRSINLLLCGLAGTGKSATGNHILGLQDKTFTVDDSDSPTTQKCEAIHSKYEERDITVVDTPGLDHKDMDVQKEVKRLIQAGEVSSHHTSTGYNVVLVTVRYGRQTNHYETTIKKFKDINGKSVLQRYGILVVTYGDDFKQQKGKDKKIASYCSQQTGLFNYLWNECNKRVVLFDNVTESEDELKAQRKYLFDTVTSMKNTRYTGETLAEAMKKNMEAFMDELCAVNIDNPKDSFFQLIAIKARAEVALEVNKLRSDDIIQAIEEKQNLVNMIIYDEARKEARNEMLKKLPTEEGKEHKKKWEDETTETIKGKKKKVEEKERKPVQIYYREDGPVKKHCPLMFHKQL